MIKKQKVGGVNLEEIDNLILRLRGEMSTECMMGM